MPPQQNTRTHINSGEVSAIGGSRLVDRQGVGSSVVRFLIKRRDIKNDPNDSAATDQTMTTSEGTRFDQDNLRESFRILGFYDINILI